MSTMMRALRLMLAVILTWAPMHAQAGMWFDPNGTGKLKPSLRQGSSIISAALPKNWDVVFYGDSRTENGITADVKSTGFVTTLKTGGVAGWLGPVSGNRLRVGRNANFGVAGSTSVQGAAVPRANTTTGQTALGQWFRGIISGALPSGADNKGVLDYTRGDGSVAKGLQSNPAGIVALLYGVNDGASSWPSTSRTAMNSIISNLVSLNEVVLLFNETPKGVDIANTVQASYDLGGAGTSAAAAWKSYSDWLSGFDYASGSDHASPNVIVVDSWNEFWDTVNQPASASRNKPGYLIEGLHPTPYGAKRLAEMAVARLSAVYGSAYNNLQSQAPVPTKDGLITYSAAQPFVNTNPVFKLGTAGQVFSSAASSPSAASVPQGWVFRASGTGIANVTVALDTTQVDADGFVVAKITLGGTLAGSGSGVTAHVQMDQNLSSSQITSAISGGQFSYSDKLREVARYALASGGSKLVNNVSTFVVLTDATSGHNMNAGAQDTVNPLAVTSHFGNAYVDAADGVTRTQLSEVLDLAQPELISAGTNPTSLTNLQTGIAIDLLGAAGSTVNETIYVSRVGTVRVSN